MATQAYMNRSNNGKKIDIKRLGQVQAPGHKAELQPRPGAENRTPAPVTTASLALEKDTAWGRGGPQANPGANAFGLASSLNPGQKAAAAAIDPHGPAGADPVLRNLVMGTKRAIDGEDDWQVRDLTDKRDNNRGRVPVHPGTQGARPGGTVPAKCGTLNDDADTRYAQARGSK